MSEEAISKDDLDAPADVSEGGASGLDTGERGETEPDAPVGTGLIEPDAILSAALERATYERAGTTAIVHIGLPKTGTTSIQHFMMKNADRLVEAGIAFIPPKYHPDSLVELPISAHFFSGQFNLPGSEDVNFKVDTPEARANRARTLLSSIVAGMTAPGVKTAILSSEFIQPWVQTKIHIDAMDLLLANFFETRRYVCYVREPLSWVVSLYSQSLKNGEDVDFATLAKRVSTSNNTAESLIFWRDTVGEERFEVGLMDRKRLKNGDMVDDFFDRLGLDVSGWDRPEEENPSLTMPAALAIEALNAQFKSPADRTAIRCRLREAIIARTADGKRLGLIPGNWSDLLHWAHRFGQILQPAFFADDPNVFAKSARFLTANDAILAQRRATRVLANVLSEQANVVARLRKAAAEQREAETSGQSAGAATDISANDQKPQDTADATTASTTTD